MALISACLLDQRPEAPAQLLTAVLTRLDRLLVRVDGFAAEIRSRHLAKLTVTGADLLPA